MATITEQAGDIFSAPPNSILIHACNAKGAWGSGVALAFKKQYPQAYHVYNKHCTTPPQGVKLSEHQISLVGTALLIPPFPPGVPATASDVTNEEQQRQHWIACLFTSLGYGRAVSAPEVIIQNTRTAMEELAVQVEALKGKGESVGECWAVRINSGRFGVRWEETKKVLERGRVDMVVVRPGDGDGEEVEGGEVEGAVKGKGRHLEKGEKNFGHRKNAGTRPLAPVHAGVAKRKKRQANKEEVS